MAYEVGSKAYHRRCYEKGGYGKPTHVFTVNEVAEVWRQLEEFLPPEVIKQAMAGKRVKLPHAILGTVSCAACRRKITGN